MTTRRTLWGLLAALPALALAKSRPAQAQAAPFPTGAAGQTMLTIFLRHDQSRTVDEINAHLKATGWFRDFPPPGVEVVSWYVMMGIGQVVTLRFAAEKLREVNHLIESEAWGGYRTEFYPTYDFRALYEASRTRMK